MGPARWSSGAIDHGDKWPSAGASDRPALPPAAIDPGGHRWALAEKKREREPISPRTRPGFPAIAVGPPPDASFALAVFVMREPPSAAATCTLSLPPAFRLIIPFVGCLEIFMHCFVWVIFQLFKQVYVLKLCKCNCAFF